MLVSDCCVKIISVLIKIIFSTSDVTIRTMVCDFGVVVFTVSSVQFSF